jgi:hypothetical protein
MRNLGADFSIRNQQVAGSSPAIGFEFRWFRRSLSAPGGTLGEAPAGLTG